MNHHFETMLKKNKMTLIMSLPANKPELADAAWENGADVIKVHINVNHRASKTVFGNFDEEKAGLEKILERSKGPCGIVIGDNIQAALRDYPKVVALGFDFISLYVSHAPPEILYDNKVLKMLALSCNDSLETASVLKTVGADILEASIMKGETRCRSHTALYTSRSCLCFTALRYSRFDDRSRGNRKRKRNDFSCRIEL